MSDDQVPAVAVGEEPDDLAAAAGGLRNEVSGLRLDVQQFGRRLSRTERVSGRTVLFVGALAVLVLLVAFVAWQQHETQQRLEDVTQQSLCPTFALLLGGFDPSTRAEGAPRDQYVATFESFRRSYEVLRCEAPLVPPRTDR